MIGRQWNLYETTQNRCQLREVKDQSLAHARYSGALTKFRLRIFRECLGTATQSRQ